MNTVKLSLFIAMLFGASSSFAEGVNALMLHLASGKQVVCLLDEKPVVTFSDDELVLTTHMNKLSYQAADVLKFTYKYVDSSGISQVGMSQAMFSFVGDVLTVTGMEPESQLTVYSVDGLLLASTVTDHGGTAAITLPDPSGKAYVVTTPVATFKVSRT